MGMFDTIQVNIQLPGYSYITDEKFQTKSFECLLENYVISDNRQIYRELWDYEWIEKPDAPLGKQLIKVEGTYRHESFLVREQTQYGYSLNGNGSRLHPYEVAHPPLLRCHNEYN